MDRKTDTKINPMPDLHRLDAALEALRGPAEPKPAPGTMARLLDRMLGLNRPRLAADRDREQDAAHGLVSRHFF